MINSSHLCCDLTRRGKWRGKEDGDGIIGDQEILPPECIRPELRLAI